MRTVLSFLLPGFLLLNPGFSQQEIPEMTVSQMDNPAPGYIYTALNSKDHGYLFAFDKEGLPVFKRVFDHSVENFQLWHNGFSSFFVDELKAYVLMDSMYRFIDTIKMKNSYRADFHDFLLLPDGHKFLMCYDPRSVDMSKIVPGGLVNATVTGTVIQELDEDKQLVFEWESWDHIPITDSYYSLTDQVIDYSHANSFLADTDTTLILSFRNTSEVIKINRNTGSILWRMGGKNNQFDYVNDQGFRGQHALNLLENGNLLLFDNAIDLENDLWLGGQGKKSQEGNLNDIDLTSRGVEYAFSENNKTLTRLREYIHDPPYQVPVKGHIQRLPSGHTLIHWSEAVPPAGKSMTEYRPDGSVSFEAGFENLVVSSYRIQKFPLQPGLFRTGRDSIDFGIVRVEQSAQTTVSLRNFSDQAVQITSVIHDHPDFSTGVTFPLSIEAGMEKEIPLSFQPSGNGYKEDMITLCFDTDSSRIARQVHVAGTGTGGTNTFRERKSVLNIYPNPAREYLHIKGLNEGDGLAVINIHGRLLIQETVQATEHILDLEGLKPGIYLLKVVGRNGGFFNEVFVRSNR